MLSLSFWDKFLENVSYIKKKNPIYYFILKDITPTGVLDDKITISCPSVGAKKYLDKKKFDLEDLLSKEVNKKISVELVLGEVKPRSTAPLLEFQPTKEDIFHKSGLNGNNTFDNFAVSNTNQVAYAASRSVGQNPGKAYNPLFLYGGVGFGKTHLAQAIAHEVLEDNMESGVLFCSGEMFMNELIESIRGKTTPRFRRKYRSLKLIVVDDIQFIAGKQTVQEEFFHTFNSIVSAGGQIVLTSDRPPQEIKNLEDRLRSRFSGGLIVDIQQPDFELRTAIILIKAKEKNITLDIEAAKIIAETVQDTRSLEGTLLSLYARSLTDNKEVGIDVVEEFFNSKTERKRTKISPQTVVKTVCSYYNVSQAQIKGPTRKSEIALARQIVMYLLRTELGMNLNEIAYFVKRKDHTTVIYAVDKVKNLSMKDPVIRDELSAITRSLLSST